MARPVPIHKLTRPEASLRASAPVVLVRLQEMLEWAEFIQDPRRVTELHEMRIAAKRLRYTLEIFAPTLDPGEVRPLLRAVEEVQERLGLIHDCDVFFPLLFRALEREMNRERKRPFGEGPPPFLAAEGLAPLLARKRAEREARYAEFLAFWQGLPADRFAEDLTRLVSGEGTILGDTSGDGPAAGS